VVEYMPSMYKDLVPRTTKKKKKKKSETMKLSLTSHLEAFFTSLNSPSIFVSYNPYLE
jgi:hypothetical protein